MTDKAKLRFARQEDLGLTKRDYGILLRLSTPRRIQDFIDAMAINHEIGGETVYSVSKVLANHRAHCIEAAMLAACALWVHGEPPLVVRLGCDPSDYPHVIALFRKNSRWGAISKSNGFPLRYRDPVYRSLRELAMSYFHEYANKRGEKTLRSYSVAFDLRKLDTELWVTAEDNCWYAHNHLEQIRHYPLLSRADANLLSRRSKFERNSAKLVEHPYPQR